MRIALVSDLHGNLPALEAGSVGLPYETLPDGADRNPPWAEYAIIEWISGELQVALRRTPYAIAPLLAAHGVVE